MRALFLLAVLSSLTLSALCPNSTFAVEPTDSLPTPPPENNPENNPVNNPVIEAIGELSQRLRLVEETTAARASSGEAPPWAADGFSEIDRRIERLARHQERALAALENPAPRLSEPMVLFSVGLCMLVLGFIAGRILGNRRARDRRGLL